MRLTILGSSGGYAGPQSSCSGYLVEHAATRLWLDAGNGTFGALQRAIGDFRQVDTIVLSHVHADHCSDLLTYYVALRYDDNGPLRRRLYCPQETWDRVAGFLQAEEDFRATFDFQPIDAGDTVEVGGLRLSFLRMDHPVHTLGVRLEDDEKKVLTYSADTYLGADLASFARGSDLLLCEATYQEEAQGGPVHLTARQAAETAVRAGAGRLLLTHLWPTLDPERSLEEARAAAGDIQVRLAVPGEAHEV
jgi:ribonuclease BN (tRNA processing enzyme)